MNESDVDKVIAKVQRDLLRAGILTREEKRLISSTRAKSPSPLTDNGQLGPDKAKGGKYL